VCHDATVDRTTNGTGAINDLTLEQIKELRIVNADGEITDLQVPTLGQVLEVIDGEVELLLEIKRKGLDNKGIEEAVLDVLKQYDAFSYTTIQSFNDSVLEKLYSLDPTLKLEKLVIAKLIGLPIIFDGSLTYFSTEKYHYIGSFNFFYRALSPSLSDYLHKEGYKTRIWTINDPGSLPNIKLDGIITDHPELF
jgi:glycerophosphoryl diester phosphodiesterase